MVEEFVGRLVEEMALELLKFQIMKHFHQSSNPQCSRLLWAQHVQGIFFSIFHQFHQDGKHHWIALLRTGQHLRNESLGLGHSTLPETETRTPDPLFPLPKTPKHAERVTTKCATKNVTETPCSNASAALTQTHGIGFTFFQVLQKLKDDRPSDGTTTGTKGGTVADDLGGVGDTQKNAWLFPKRFLKPSF